MPRLTKGVVVSRTDLPGHPQGVVVGRVTGYETPRGHMIVCKLSSRGAAYIDTWDTRTLRRERSVTKIPAACVSALRAWRRSGRIA